MNGTMRHIPDDELHACLDQALSRSQCVEIESHLAECVHCRMARDEIAALRDSTTALLGKLGPRRIEWVPLGTLQVEAESRRLRTRRWIRAGAWAATLLVAIGLGWQARQWRRALTAPTPPVSSTVAGPAAVPPAPEALPTVAIDRTTAPVRRQAPAPASATLIPNGPDAAPALATGPAEAPVGVEVSAIEPSRAVSQLPASGLWRIVALEPATDSSGPTRVDGLPVVQVQVQQAGTEREITAVDQRLGSGEVIRLVDGPASQLADLMAAELATTQAANQAADPTEETAHGDATLTQRMGSRVLLLTGPPEMLSTLMTRVKVGTAAEKK